MGLTYLGFSKMVDQQMRNGSFNGSFLVLNLGTNTLEVGKSFTQPSPSESIHQIRKDTNPSPPIPSKSNNAFDAVSSSSQEGSFSTSETSRTKRGSEAEEDPDWVPEKKVRKSSSSGNRTVKLKQGPLVSSNPQMLLGGFSGMPSSRSGLPPPHLIGLLTFYGWKVVFQPDKGDYVYISPIGLPYYSLPKAFESLLQGSSKYSEKASVSSCYSENSSIAGNLVQRAVASSSYLGVQSDNGADVCRKKRRGRRKKTTSAEENTNPIESIKEKLPLADDSLIDNGKQSLQTAGVECQLANHASSLCKINERTKCYAEDTCLSNEFNQGASSTRLANWDSLHNGNVSGIKRSGQTSGRHVLVDHEMNVLSGSGVCGGKATDKEQNPTSQSKNMLKERHEACKTGKGSNNEVRNSDCSGMDVMRSGQNSWRSKGKARRSAGLRRSGRLSKQNNLLDRDLDNDKQVESSFPVSAKPVTQTVAREEERKSLVAECVLDDKSYCSTSDESLDGETKRSDSDSVFLLSESNDSDMHGCHDATGIRRSTRINGKHVPVDDDSDVEIGFDNYLLYPSELGDSVVVKDRKKPRTSSFEVDGKEGGNPGQDDLLKQKNMNNFCCKKLGFAKSSVSSEQKPMEISGLAKSFSSFAAEGKLVRCGNFHRKNKKKRRGGCGLTVRRNRKDDHQEENSQSKLNILSWLIDSGSLTENERIYYISKNSTANTPGFVTRRGIWCNCCKELVPLSKFVAHAGGKVQQPWDNIFLLSGKTLTLCLKEAWEKEKTQRKVGFRTVGVGDPDPSDDTCGICADGGHLICCDSCPSTFHQTCLMLKTLPEGSWYCPYCVCTFCMAVVCSSDMPLEDLNLLSCKHCGRKYHKNCAWGGNIDLMSSVPFSYCGKNCQKVATELLDLLGITNPMEEGFSWILLKHLDEDAGIISNQRLSSIVESNVRLSMALSVLDECFVPLIDQRTGVDMICQAVYNCGSNFNRLNYEGFYTLILERDEEIISAASLRLHGASLAEMPFIGTRPMYRRQGMCRRLLKAVENILCSLHVDKLIIPAIPDMLETWTKSFSFKPLEQSHREEVKNLSLMVFAETTLLQKSMHSKGAFVQEDVVPYNRVSCKNIQENNEFSRSFGDQINTGSHVGLVVNIQETHELQKSLGDHIDTRSHFGSGQNIQKSHEPQSSFGDQKNATSHSGSRNNIQETHETCFSDERNTRTDLVGSGSIYGENIQESHELQRSHGDQINIRNHFGSGNSIHENHVVQKSCADQTITRSHLVDKGHSYRGNTRCSHEVQKSSADKINPRSHFGIWKNVKESHEIQISFADQINSRSHVDNGVSHVKNIHENHGLQRSFGNQLPSRDHPGSGNSIQKSSEVQRSFGNQIKNSGDVGFQKSIQEGIGLLRSSSDQINNANHFVGAPDWWFRGCMLKGQADSASDPCGIFKGSSSIAPDSVARLPPNLSNGSIFEASPSRHTFMRNLSAVSHNHTTCVAHDTLAIQPPNICNGSASEALPFQCTSMTNLFSVPRNPIASIFPDSLPIVPPNISNGPIFEASPFQSTFATNLNTVSHNITASDTPAPLAAPNIPNGSISEASPVDCMVMQNLGTFPHNPTTTLNPSASIDVVLDSDPLCIGSIAAPNSHLNSQSQGADAVKNLQMEAIRSSISFDNLLRAIS